jgi:hypothetical protein
MLINTYYVTGSIKGRPHCYQTIDLNNAISVLNQTDLKIIYTYDKNGNKLIIKRKYINESK